MKLVVLLASVVAAQGQTPIRPSYDSAKANANHIFNAIHSTGRQWGSSLNHNGFGFIPVVVPAGISLYHGGYFEQPPEGPEWLAFEVEHAENFARVPKGGPRGCRPCRDEQLHSLSSEQKPLDQAGIDGCDCEVEGRVRGYLQTYQTTRNVQLLYLDGTSAGKSPVGTLDSQDEVLCQSNSSRWDDMGGEMYRAKALCDLITEWGWDGIMRMEIGFEVIYCNFSSGLNLDSSIRTLVPEDRLEDDFSLIPYLWSRAATERYDGLGGDRIQMDFSSMVSGFFFPINISNTDPDRPDLIRLGAAQREHLLDIKNYIQTLFVEPRKFIVNWQAVVDMIIARFGNRLAAMASASVSTDLFIGELEGTVLTYLEAPSLPGDVTLAEDDDGRNRTAEAIDRCASHYLKPALLSQQDWTLSDSLIHTALGTVTQHICSDLYFMRSILLQASPDAAPDAYLIKRGVKSADMEEAVNQTRTIVRDLMQDLAWTTWKKPQLCVEGQILLTAMWPLGDSVDHFNPGCVPAQDITGRRRNYWTPYEKRPRID
ncbi:uncharacterized protein TRIVIDRAFT_182477 [Trichoderma virens Gv29-8]|uniref:Heterokaryon incompatibility domain-containing protein n=1 Tax=Hypocrea virens (strain Gv29-8 / FGSC 10586) TaxID=413071 RepID=G9N473_HYPVG|nr:uncharacterized protein TRIVIDRAFT_182477 [Trichoderma virens Gv29-8]EHK18399.1 hypothetical protein TRIVIDRAFT_182477 [Trichoderma virens Gv29-8]